MKTTTMPTDSVHGPRRRINRWPTMLLSGLLLGCVWQFATSATAAPGVAAGKSAKGNLLEELPDFYQEDPRGGFVNNGANYCCPVSVANSLLYLGRHGHPGLLAHPEKTDTEAEIELIHTLCSRDYFGTDPGNGTSPSGLLRGLHKYVRENGYACGRLEYEGWREIIRTERIAVTAELPQLNWLKSGLRNPNGAVWLNVGWYEQTAQPGQWKRVGGHWVTVAGCGATNQPNLLLLHNPAINRAKLPKNVPGDYSSYAVELAPAPEKTLLLENGKTRRSTGMFIVTGRGLPHSEHIAAALLDAAVVFVIEP